MRIIAGQWRGRKLLAPKPVLSGRPGRRAEGGDATRPTADRTREALFSMLASRVGSFEGLAVADLFAGSGALGLEALSRGAALCLFVEQDKPALDALRANIAALGAAQAEVRAGSVLALPPAPRPYDLLVLDPPYRTGAGSVALDRLARLGWTGPATWISVETAKEEAVEVQGFAADAVRTHGAARITLLRAG